jgi:hypothetical protein
MPYETAQKFLGDDEQDESNSGLADWLKEWTRREALVEKLKRISK